MQSLTSASWMKKKKNTGQKRVRSKGMTEFRFFKDANKLLANHSCAFDL